MYKLLILSADPTILKWRSLAKKKAAILAALNKTKNGVWELDIQYRPIAPKVLATGRIEQEWYNSFSYPLFDAGNHFIYLHFSLKQWKSWGLDRSIRGANQIDTDFVGESYGKSDERTLRNRENLFVQNVLHEMSHEIARTTKVPDFTHAHHAVDPDISKIFTMYDMANWQPVYQNGIKTVSMLTKLFELTKQLLQKKQEPTTLLHPIPAQFRRITQGYGVPNKIYSLTGHHTGSDYGTPAGTPIYAPWQGETVEVGSTRVLGNYCVYEFDFSGMTYAMRVLHQQEIPKKGLYKRGDVIGYSGNTGMSTGAHCHIDVFKFAVNLTGINANNFRERTVDPEVLFKA